MKIVLFANTDWYLYNFRRSMALSLRDAGHELLLISPDGEYGHKLRELGLRWQPLPMQRLSINPLRELAVLWHLIQLYRREKPGMVHSSTAKCAVYGSLAARLAGVPAQISEMTGMGYIFISNDIKARLLRPLVRSLLSLATKGNGSKLLMQNAEYVAMFKLAQSGARINLDNPTSVPEATVRTWVAQGIVDSPRIHWLD